MRIGKPTRLERQIHKQIIQQHAREWMAERGYEPAMCSRCGDVPPADDCYGMCRLCYQHSQRPEPSP